MATRGVRIVSWNINCQARMLVGAEGQGVDVALVQEARPPGPEIAIQTIPAAHSDWTTSGGRRSFCAAIASFNAGLEVRPIATKPIDDAQEGEMPVSSRRGALAIAELKAPGMEPIVVASAYGVWEGIQGSQDTWADSSVHRLISDLPPNSLGWRH